MEGFFINQLFVNPVYYVMSVLVVMFSICLHEFAHAHTAQKRGDDTAALLGHLSMNPLKQMGPLSIGILLVIGIAWGAVPVNPRNLRNGARDEAIVAVAGPASNLFLCAAFAMIWSLSGFSAADFHASNPAAILLLQGAVMNGALFILNMLPFPPLDGFKLAQFIFPNLRHLHPQLLQQASTIGLILIFMTDIGSFIFGGGVWLAERFMFSR